jgi:hypothetical protein
MVKLPYHSVYDFAKQHSGIAAINDWVNGSQNTNISLGGKTFSTVFDYDIMKYDI